MVCKSCSNPNFKKCLGKYALKTHRWSLFYAPKFLDKDLKSSLDSPKGFCLSKTNTSLFPGFNLLRIQESKNLP